jgi:Holliday junction resolvasome RuvABC ATP-dependent DNA helicase subunit
MTDTPNPREALHRARAKVDQAFASFVANTEAVYAIKRALTVAIAQTPDGAVVSMPKSFLLSGPASVGKTDLSKRIAQVLGLPQVRIDGRAVKTREKLFETIDEALSAHNLSAMYKEDRGGMPAFAYPPFLVFIDEAHLAGEKAQESFLTLLEADDRTIVLDGARGRRLALVEKACFVLATTKPADLDKAFRSRCIEIQLRRYTVAEVAEMVKARYTYLPDSAIDRISACSRTLPRVAFAMAEDVHDEVVYADEDTPDIKACVKRVMNGRGILFANGVTRDDLRYLEVLKKEGRSLGERHIKAQLFDVDEARVTDDIEPFLLSLEYIRMTGGGRALTPAGEEFLRDAKQVKQAGR